MTDFIAPIALLVFFVVIQAGTYFGLEFLAEKGVFTKINRMAKRLVASRR